MSPGTYKEGARFGHNRVRSRPQPGMSKERPPHLQVLPFGKKYLQFPVFRILKCQETWILRIHSRGELFSLQSPVTAPGLTVR